METGRNLLVASKDWAGTYFRPLAASLVAEWASTGQIIAVSYTAKGDAIVAENPRVWLAKQVGADWDVSPDGKRVVVLGTLDPPGESRAAAKQEHEMVMKCGVIHGHDQSSIGRFFDSDRKPACC
jgi:hypothetical protein